MKKFLPYLIALSVAAGAVVVGCDPKEEGGGKTVLVQSVSLDRADTTLTVGETFTLTHTIVPDTATNKTVSWENSNPSVASVLSTGLVTALTPGTTTIVVVTKSGNKTASCAVTVNAATVAVSNVSLTPTAATLTVGEQFALTHTIAPENATNSAVTWNSSSTVATVVNGVVTAAALGEATITVGSTDGSSKSATCVVTVVSPSTWSTTSMGIASFATTQQWTVGTQTWSDAVQTTVCSGKTTYDGDNTAGDCRSNPGYPGDLFNWWSVENNKQGLCPPGWRVPTSADFIALDIALGGNGEARYDDTQIVEKYRGATWGGAYGGYANCYGTLGNQGLYCNYWSSTPDETGRTYANTFFVGSDGGVSQKLKNTRCNGGSVRCVRDAE